MRYHAFALLAWLPVACGGGPAEPLAVPPPAPSAHAPEQATAEPPEPADNPPPAPTSAATPDGPPAAPEPPAPAAPPTVEVGAPSWVGDGTVPKVEVSLGKTREDVAKCVADNGGLSAETGEMKVQFLVSLRARAEGVEVLSSKAVNEEAERCVRERLKGMRVQTPTADPVGVQFRYRFTRAAPDQ